MADLAACTPAGAETRFGIGSISKTLTLAAALALVDAGKLDLDAPVERYLPGFPHAGQGVTVRRIGAHQSGIADDFANDHYYSIEHFELDSAYRRSPRRRWPSGQVPGRSTAPDCSRSWAGCWSG